MTTVMYRSGKRLRLLVNDPNHIISERHNVRPIEDVLERINDLDKIDRPLVGANTASNPSKKADNELKNRYKRQKTSPDHKSDHQSSVSSTQICEDLDFRVFRVIYGTYKPQKKHKQFSFDGFLTLANKDLSIRLYSIEGKGISQPKVMKSLEEIESGKRLVIGARELEIDEEVSAIDFKNKKLFIQSDD